MFRKIIEECNASSIRAPCTPARVHAHIHIHILAIEKVSRVIVTLCQQQLRIRMECVAFFLWYTDNINALYFIISNNIYKTYKSHT